MDRADASDEVAVAAAGKGDPADAGDCFLSMDAKSGPEASGDASKGASLSSVRRERKGEAVALPIEPKLLSIVLLLQTRLCQCDPRNNKRETKSVEAEREREWESYLRLGGESSAMPLGRKYAMALSPSESLMASAPSTAIGQIG